MNKEERLILKAFMEIEVPKFSDKVLNGEPFFVIHDYYAGYVTQLMAHVKIDIKKKSLFDKDIEKAIDLEFNNFNAQEKIDAIIYIRLFRLVYDIIVKYSM